MEISNCTIIDSNLIQYTPWKLDKKEYYVSQIKSHNEAIKYLETELNKDIQYMNDVVDHHLLLNDDGLLSPKTKKKLAKLVTTAMRIEYFFTGKKNYSKKSREARTIILEHYKEQEKVIQTGEIFIGLLKNLNDKKMEFNSVQDYEKLVNEWDEKITTLAYLTRRRRENFEKIDKYEKKNEKDYFL